MATIFRNSQAGACTISLDGAKLFRTLLLQEINSKKILILEESSRNPARSVTSALKELSVVHGVPLSTLKQNALCLKQFGLVEFGTNSEKRGLSITKTGKEVLRFIVQKV